MRPETPGHVAMVVAYFGLDEYVPELNEVGWFGALSGMCALLVFAAGAFRANVLVRIGAALVLASVTHTVITVVATLVSLIGDRGGERGTLEDGAVGFLWLVVAVVLLWRVVAGKWPATR
ncbi:hypothetical protein ACIQMJ_12845 [Actinosynnema sp. NPDC091369]